MILADRPLIRWFFFYILLSLKITSSNCLSAIASSAIDLKAWYKATGAIVSITTPTSTIATAEETVGTITLSCAWSAKKANNTDVFALTGATPDKLSFVDFTDGKTYVYNGTVDENHKQEVSSRGGEQFAIVTVRLTGTITSAQHGSYKFTVEAGANDSTTQDILYIYQTVGATSVTRTEANFGKSLDLAASTTLSSASVDVSYSFIVAAKGLDQDQSTEYNNGTLTVKGVLL